MNHECSCYCFFIADCHLNPDSNENSTDPDPIIDFYALETYHQKVLQDNCKTFLFLKTWFASRVPEGSLAGFFGVRF